MSVNGTLVEDKMHRFKSEYAHFKFNKCPIYTHDGASAKFNTISQETDNSADLQVVCAVVNFHSNWDNTQILVSNFR
jgi:hypothetical protein